MIELVRGNILAADAEAIVNAVNCVGVMGKGIALEFKSRFPDMYADYERRCREGMVKPGVPYLYKHGWSPRVNPRGPWVLNFPTKRHWRDPSRLEDIVAGLEYVRRHCHDWAITSMAVPALGVGNGGLEWGVVLPVLQEHLELLRGVRVVVYEPLETVENRQGRAAAGNLAPTSR